MRYAGASLASACERALGWVADEGGLGGCIAMDAKGRMALPFNAPGMPRGWIDATTVARIAIHPGDELAMP